MCHAERESMGNNIYSQMSLGSSSEQRNHILKTKKIISSSILKEDFASSCN
jgi:hypothetical protein